MKTKKKLQLKYVRLIAFTNLIPLLIVGGGFYYIFHIVLETAQLGRYAEERFGDIFFWLNILTGIVMVLAIIVAWWLALHFSHKIAGVMQDREFKSQDV